MQTIVTALKDGRTRRAGRVGMTRTIASFQRWATSLVLVAVALGAVAQDDEATDDPCGKPTDRKIVKLLEDAGKAKEAMERHQKLKAALEL
ncbi:MAG: hypothetical protein KDB95_07815, partial [Flavobacteriales bacterium]|nr:hypothetical protein [Flavobacteriales bacterium]